MKKQNLLFTAFIFALFLVGSTLFAQPMTKYTWDDYSMKFEIPKTFTVYENNIDKFDAGDDDIRLTIYPRKGEYLSFSKMRRKLEDWAYDSGVYGFDNVNEMEDLNGYWGVYIDGKKRSNDLPATLLLLVHPTYNSNSMYIWINYRSDAFDTALKMLKSFKPTY
jgi:hypothetical protein